MEFHIPYLKMLKEEGWETAVAARNDYENPINCQIPYCDTYFDIHFERNPFHPKNAEAYKQLKKIIDSENYDIVHCHTPVGGVLARIASKDARKNGTKVIYTAHGFHFYDGAPLINWVLYYPIERLLAHYTDVLITINQEDYLRAQTFKVKKVYYIPGVGIDLEKFQPNSQARKTIRQELGFQESDFVILSVGELNKNKNQANVLKALASMKESESYSKTYYVLCGSGAWERKLKQMAVKLGINAHVRFLGYQTDTPKIYNASDLFVFMSFREGLPVALIEAMACGLPVLCSKIRGNKDLVLENVTGLFSENDPSTISLKLQDLYYRKDKRYLFAHNATFSIEKFSINLLKKHIYQIYKNAL